MVLTFAIVVIVFHLSELAFIFWFHRERLSWESALLTPGYVAMLGVALGEYWLEKRFVPWLKVDAVSWVGVGLVVAGEIVRMTGMLTAARAFTHKIAEVRRDEHALVTHGIYRWVRHPGYLGWFWWAIGAQLVLVNPVSTLLAAVMAYRFFARRIPKEEALLVQFFPRDYEEYRRRTPTLLPLIP